MQSTNNEPTYEEYLKATKYAQWRYKYGLFVLIGCWICLVILIVYIYFYATELATHPIIYVMDKFSLENCYCRGVEGDYYINSTSISVSSPPPH